MGDANANVSIRVAPMYPYASRQCMYPYASRQCIHTRRLSDDRKGKLMRVGIVDRSRQIWTEVANIGRTDKAAMIRDTIWKETVRSEIPRGDQK